MLSLNSRRSVCHPLPSHRILHHFVWVDRSFFTVFVVVSRRSYNSLSERVIGFCSVIFSSTKSITFFSVTSSKEKNFVGDLQCMILFLSGVTVSLVINTTVCIRFEVFLLTDELFRYLGSSLKKRLTLSSVSVGQGDSFVWGRLAS